ncbi:hypothetical protein ACFCV8_28955 [Streptomyces sp. NPDC056347]|uniref:hypothetical protein n=1 Tax=Streptomyces sp. NPDC056347 TaxID=3345790 RepID=UPI0035DD91E1
MIRDESLWVRHCAVQSLSGHDDRSAPVLDAFLALLDEDDADMRLEAAWAPARRDHPRTEEAYERVGPLDVFPEHDHRTSGPWRYRANLPRNRRTRAGTGIRTGLGVRPS